MACKGAGPRSSVDDGPRAGTVTTNGPSPPTALLPRARVARDGIDDATVTASIMRRSAIGACKRTAADRYAPPMVTNPGGCASKTVIVTLSGRSSTSTRSSSHAEFVDQRTVSTHGSSPDGSHACHDTGSTCGSAEPSHFKRTSVP